MTEGESGKKKTVTERNEKKSDIRPTTRRCILSLLRAKYTLSNGVWKDGAVQKIAICDLPIFPIHVGNRNL